MTAIKFDAFLAAVPRTHKLFLGQGQAQIAVNCRLTDGTLTSFRGPKLIATPENIDDSPIRTMYRVVVNGVASWLTWTVDVAVVKSPIFPDRIYWTGDGEPRQTTIALAVSGTPMPFVWYALGIPSPTTAATLGASGGVGAATTRSYVYTRVDTWGQESGPSPAVTVSGKVDDTWALSNLQGDPPNSGTVSAATHTSGVVTVTMDTTAFLRAGETLTFASIVGMTDLNGTFEILSVQDATHVTVTLTTAQTYTSGGTWTRNAPFIVAGMAKNIYRTILGTYFYVGTTTGTTYNDTALDSVVALHATLPSLFWEQPPTTLVGLDVLANGSMCSICGNQVRFSEPGYPHAWPSIYSEQLSHPGVNLKAIENQVIVGTEGPVWVLTGSSPLSMPGIPHPASWPCLSFASMVKGVYGVEFACPEGLAVFPPGGGAIATASLFTEVEWGALYPSTFVAAHHAGRYYTSFVNADESAMLILQRGEAASLLKANVVATAVYACADDSKLYLAVGNSIYEWDGDAGTKMVFDWLSREVAFPNPTVMGAFLVDADFDMTQEEIDAAQVVYDAMLEQNEDAIAALLGVGDINGFEFNTTPIGGDSLLTLPVLEFSSVLFQFYVDGTLRYSATVIDSRGHRLPKYSSADQIAIRLSGNARVTAAFVASSLQELKTV